MCPTTTRARSDAAEPKTEPAPAEPNTKKRRPSRLTTRRVVLLTVLLLLAGGAALGYVTREAWTPAAGQVLESVRDRLAGPGGEGDHHGEADAHAGHDHGAGGDDTSIELSEQGRKNIGLKLVTIEPRDFERTVNIPGMIVERPGRTEINVSAPMTGIVTRIFPIRGEAVRYGETLFDLRLTHEDLVDTQSTFLQTLEQLDVIKKEVARLEDVTSSGAVAGKRLLERQYDQQQTEASLRAQRQALLLHGLTEEQIEHIVATRELLQEATIEAPRPADCESCRGHGEYLQVRDLEVNAGEQVSAGTKLCTLTDHCELYVEGKAFEEDAQDLTEAANQGTPITAVVEGNGHGTQTVPDLKILYVENSVERDSRALRFYVKLPNELVRNEATEDGHRFIGWRYKPGQRVQLYVPVQRWEDRIVLPVDAVVKEGAEWFVFQEDGDRFVRVAVHVEYRDQRWAVIESDGTLFPGDVVAAAGAYQIHLAMKNKAGAGVDPHAGHHH